MATRNVGILPMNEKYTLVEIKYTDEDFACFCDNCGKNIKNIAVIKDSKNHKINVGLDCFSTLEKGEINDYWKTKDDIKKFMNFKSSISKGNKILKEGGCVVMSKRMGMYFYRCKDISEWSSHFALCDRSIYHEYVDRFRDVFLPMAKSIQ